MRIAHYAMSAGAAQFLALSAHAQDEGDGEFIAHCSSRYFDVIIVPLHAGNECST